MRVWRKLLLSSTTCLFSDLVSRSLFYLQHLIRVSTLSDQPSLLYLLTFSFPSLSLSEDLPGGGERLLICLTAPQSVWSLARYSPVSAHYPTFQSVPRHITNCLPHSLAQDAPVCFAPFSEFHLSTPPWLQLPPQSYCDKQNQESRCRTDTDTPSPSTPDRPPVLSLSQSATLPRPAYT